MSKQWGKVQLQGDYIFSKEVDGYLMTFILLHHEAENIEYAMAKDGRKQAAIRADSKFFEPLEHYHFYESDMGCEKVVKFEELENYEQIKMPELFLHNIQNVLVFVYEIVPLDNESK